MPNTHTRTHIYKQICIHFQKTLPSAICPRLATLAVTGFISLCMCVLLSVGVIDPGDVVQMHEYINRY